MTPLVGAGMSTGAAIILMHGAQRIFGGRPWLSAAFAAALLGAPTSSHAVTLREELVQLLQNNPRIKSDEFAAKSAAEQVRGAFGGFLPKVDLSGDTGHETIHGPTTVNFENGTSSMARKKVTLSVSQKLFDGFRAYETYGAAQIKKEVAESTLAATRQQMIFDGISAYYGVLRQSRLVEIAVANEDTIRTQTQLEDARVQRGAGIALDVLFAKNRLSLARENRIALEGTLREVVARYVQIFSHAPDIAALQPPQLELAALPKTLEEANQTAMKNNPTLAASERQIDVAEKNRGIAESALYPNLDLVGQANWERNVDSYAGIRKDYSVLVRFTWELFSGFTAQSQIAQATLDKSGASETYIYNRRRISEELEIAWEALMTARERVKVLDNAVSIAEEVFDARRRLRDAGRETAINVLDAQREVFDARSKLTAANYDAQVAVFKVLLAMGLLGPDNLGL